MISVLFRIPATERLIMAIGVNWRVLARIVSASLDGTVRVWATDLKGLIERAVSFLPRCLTAKERSDFFLEPEDPPWCDRFKKQASPDQPQ